MQDSGQAVQRGLRPLDCESVAESVAGFVCTVDKYRVLGVKVLVIRGCHRHTIQRTAVGKTTRKREERRSFCRLLNSLTYADQALEESPFPTLRAGANTGSLEANSMSATIRHARRAIRWFFQEKHLPRDSRMPKIPEKKPTVPSPHAHPSIIFHLNDYCSNVNPRPTTIP